MNLNSYCDQFDAFLSDALSLDERAVFESHIRECSACREAIDQQQWIDALLQSPERVQLERPTATILDSFRVSVTQRRQRSVRAACALATAATLLVAVGLLKLNRQANEPSKPGAYDISVDETVQAPSPAQPAATFVTTSEAIVVPLENPSEDVTIVQVYPTIDAERLLRLEATLSTHL